MQTRWCSSTRQRPALDRQLDRSSIASMIYLQPLPFYCGAPARWSAIAASSISVSTGTLARHRRSAAVRCRLAGGTPTALRLLPPADYRTLVGIGRADARDIHCSRLWWRWSDNDEKRGLGADSHRRDAQCGGPAAAQGGRARDCRHCGQSGQCLDALERVAIKRPILAGLACYVVSVVVWILALSRVDVSVAYPMLSIGYVVNAVAAGCCSPSSSARRASPASASSSSAAGWSRAADAHADAAMRSMSQRIPALHPPLDR